MEASCLIPTIFAILFGAGFVATLISTIVLAVRHPSCDESSSSSIPTPPTYAVSFTEYTSEQIDLTFFKEDPWNFRKGDPRKECVFSESNWFSEEYYDGFLMTRVIATDDDINSVTMCTNMTNHSYCYKQSANAKGGFRIPYAVPLKAAGVPCYELFPQLQVILPNRKLDKCDFYGAADYDMDIFSVTDYSFESDAMVYWIVESGTNYPVVTQYKKLGDGLSRMTLFNSFTNGKPKDESGLKPFPGVRIYDFRDGMGDVEDCKFNLKAELANSSPEDVKYVAPIRRSRKIREALHLPLMGFAGVNPALQRGTVVRDNIPDEFDARTHWSSCNDVIGTITDQDICGSCWAMASTGILSDRLCISKGIKEQLSPQYMVYCGKLSKGCDGAFITPAWDDLIDQGTVSESCLPFTARAGDCPVVCKNYSLIDDSMKVRPTAYTYPWGETDEERVKAIQSEIMTNGPVMAGFLFFDDFRPFFRQFPQGVYRRSKQASMDGGHYVRIIGWGTTPEGEDYWLVANSWGVSFADHGYFKIRRGTNECNIEEEVGGLVA